MSRMDLGQIQNLISARAVSVCMTAGLAIWFPSKTDYYEFVHVQEGLSVSISQSSPPRALLEDELLRPLEMIPEKPLVAKPGQTLLLSGEADFVITPRLFANEMARVQIALTRKLKAKDIKDVEQTVAKQSDENPIPPRMLPSISFFSVAEANTTKVANNNDEHVGATRGERVPDFGEAFKTTTKVIEPSEPQDRSYGRDPDEDLDLPIASTQIPKLKDTPWRFIPRSENTTHTITTANPIVKKEPQNNPDPTTLLPDESTPAKPAKTATVASRSLLAKNQSGQVLIQGAIEFKNGLALVDGASLEVFHEVSGEPQERAQVLLREGRYEIYIQDRSEGVLVAEVRDQDKMLIGQVEVPLDEVDYSDLEGGLRKTMNLNLTPVSTSVEGRVSSIYSNGQGEPDSIVTISGFNKHIKTDKKGRFTQTHILHNSQVLITSNKTGHWGSLALTDNNKNIELKLFPDKMIQALAQMSEAEKGFEEQGIIWGRVETAGQPVQGATVQATAADAIGPIYFNALQLPDLEMKETGSNGLFAFIQVEPGFQVVRATNKGRVFPAKAIVVERGMVSQTTVEVASTKRARAIIYDALAGTPLESDLQFSGTDKSAHATKGLLGVSYHFGRDLMFLEADAASEYLPVRQTLSRDVTHINFPMIKRAFVDDMVNATRVNRMPQTGMAIGFVRGADYQIIMPEGSTADVIYFNSEGQSVGSEAGVRGGGFILLNLQPGIQAVAIAPVGKKALALKVIYSDPSRASIINYKF